MLNYITGIYYLYNPYMLLYTNLENYKGIHWQHRGRISRKPRFIKTLVWNKYDVYDEYDSVTRLNEYPLYLYTFLQ